METPDIYTADCVLCERKPCLDRSDFCQECTDDHNGDDKGIPDFHSPAVSEAALEQACEEYVLSWELHRTIAASSFASSRKFYRKAQRKRFPTN